MRLIDADAIIEDIKTRLWDWDTVDGITASTVLKQTITDIDNAPTIETVRHGRWEVIDEAEPRRYGCSICRRLSWYMDNYCPNCGAKMDEEE